jgi:hypothetical protein
MDNTNMAQGLSFAEDMKRLEELKKQFEITQSPDFSMDMPELQAPSMQITPEDLQGMSSNLNASKPQMDREQMLQQYRENLMKKLQGSEDRLSEAEKAFATSQEAGGGWKGGIAKGLGVLGDTLSAMGGGQTGHTKNIMGQFAGDKKSGAEAYKTALEKEKGILGEIEKTDKSSMEAAKMKDFMQSRDPNSEESKAARLFAKKAYNLPKLPDSMNAIQVKVYLDQYAKKHNLASAEEWRQKNYDQRERGIAATQEQKTRLSPTETLKVSEGKAIPDTLDDIEKSMEMNKDLFASTTFKPWAEGSAYVRKQTGAPEQKFDSKMKSASQQFGRYMEGGVLRKEDEKKYYDMFPGMQDTYDVAQAKLQNIREMMMRKQQTDLDALKAQGKSTAGLEFAPKSTGGGAPWMKYGGK